LVKQGSLVKNLKERFATLQIGPQSTVIFDYKKDETSLNVNGMYTMSSAAKCLPGPATFPYPADLVMKLEIGDGKSHVLLCFDAKEELDSFKAAVEFGLNSENFMKTYLAKKEADQKREEAQRMLRLQEEKAKAILLEQQIAQIQQLAAENQAINARFEAEQQTLKESVSEMRHSISIDQHKLEEELSTLRASVSEDLLKRRQSLDEVSERAKSLVDYNMQASASLAEMESSIDNQFAAFRKRENSSAVLRTTNAAEYAQRAELERLHMLALEQEELERQTKILAEQRRKELEAAGLRGASAEALAPERKYRERADSQNVGELHTINHEGKAAPQRPEVGSLVQERLKRLSVSGSPQASHPSPGRRASLAPLHQADGTLKTPAAASSPQLHLHDAASHSTLSAEAPANASVHPVGEPIKERIKRLSVIAAAVSSLQPVASSSNLDQSEVIVPTSERARRPSLIAASISNKADGSVYSPTSSDAPPSQKAAARRPSIEVSAIPIKERLRQLTESSHSGSAANPQQKELPVDGSIEPVKERLKRMSLSVSSESPQQKSGGKQPMSLLLEKDAAAP
jgi:hypothetical protein